MAEEAFEVVAAVDERPGSGEFDESGGVGAFG